jgi:hypothetical protein
MGGQVVALLDTSRNYRVLGVLALARYAMWVGPRFSMGASLGIGPGYDANILRNGLSGGEGVALYGRMGVDARWRLGENHFLGVHLGSTNAATADVAFVAGLRL